MIVVKNGMGMVLKMTMNEYQRLAARTMNKTLDRSEVTLHSLHGLSAEVGELHGIYQKMYQGHRMTKEHLQKELGDILWMIAEFCTGNDWQLEQIAQMNIDKLKARYPEGFDAEHSLHRKEGDV